MVNATRPSDTFARALANLDPDSQLAIELDRLRDESPVVFHDGKWLYEGLIEVLMNVKRQMMAVDDSIPPGLPPHCLDPQFIADFFGLPVEEFNVPTTAFAFDAVKMQLKAVEQTVDRFASVALSSQDRTRQKSIFYVDLAENEMTFHGKTYHLDRIYICILDVLVQANGEWRSRRQMQEEYPELEIEDRLDRRIRDMKKDCPILAPHLESGRNGYRLRL